MYSPIGSKNGRVLYKKTELDQNGLTWYMHFDETQEKWKYENTATPWSSFDDFNGNSLGEICYNLTKMSKNSVVSIFNYELKLMVYQQTR